MTTTDTVAALRALADYIEKHDVPRLLSAGRDTLALGMHGRGDMAVFLRWADTLDGPVRLSAMPNEDTYHLHARGTLPGTAFAADLVVIVKGEESAALAEEIGRDGFDIPVSRDLLDKIAAAGKVGAS